jgi:hypothetical protein
MERVVQRGLERVEGLGSTRRVFARGIATEPCWRTWMRAESINPTPQQASLQIFLQIGIEAGGSVVPAIHPRCRPPPRSTHGPPRAQNRPANAFEDGSGTPSPRQGFQAGSRGSGSVPPVGRANEGLDSASGAWHALGVNFNEGTRFKGVCPKFICEFYGQPIVFIGYEQYDR